AAAAAPVRPRRVRVMGFLRSGCGRLWRRPPLAPTVRPMTASVNGSSINVALVGYGFAGRTFHAPLIRATPGLALHTVVSSRPEDVHADLPDVRVVGDVETVLADRSIGLMVIATPNDLHAPLARRAVETGMAVVVDKPFTVTLDEARDLQSLSEDKGG